jgi:hypothetical protein
VAGRVVENAVTGWVRGWTWCGVLVGRRWIPWAIGAVARPHLGEYAQVTLDDEGCAVEFEVRGWRPTSPSAN